MKGLGTPGIGAIGDLDCNTYFNLGLADVSLSLARTFRVPWVMGTEPATLQVRVDAFNALNLTQLNSVESNMNNVQFGRVTSARDGRRYQLGMRFTFQYYRS